MTLAIIFGVLGVGLAYSRGQAKKPIGLLPIVLLAAAAGLFFFGRSAGTPALPQPAGPDLVQAFATNDDRAQAHAHAQAFGAICFSLADVLEYDGALEAPRIKSGVQVDDLRRWTRENHLAGRSFAAKYPGLKSAVEQHLTQALGTAGGNLSPEQRAKWVTAFRELAANAEYAAKQ